MRKATRTRMTLAAIVAGSAVLAAACIGPPSTSDAAPKHTSRPACRKVVGKAHVEGTKRWYLTLKGRHQSVLVSNKEYKRYGIGKCFPTEGR